ncbi:hypothetical protein EDD16DRAFT_1893144 [Pisolithus croceorrhizus]|nr:hypothetical protein EV401DRAFT_2075585 [Pisolithus croceorrhizus]KAI6126143.1 hypothetical protein EDD16DRAFT_1893144 [Pisolithus croceorrhizus]
MPNPLRPSKNAVIYSLVDGEPYVGIPPTKPVTVPVRLYARDSVTEAPTFNLEKVGESTYVISANGYKTQDQDGLLVGSIEGDAQRWYIEYAERHDAYIITKENERSVGWVAPTDDDEGQIRVRILIVGPSLPPYYPSNELFRFKYLA